MERPGEPDLPWSRKGPSPESEEREKKINPMARQISKKAKRKTPKGVVHIQASFNNTIITITTLRGEVISWSSAGACGFRGARKGTPFAAKTAAATAAKESMTQGMQQARVMVKGIGPGRDTAIRGLQEAGLRVKLIRDITPIPHNGCRPPKKRRI
jgi:small subunit ribosomal protein S11